jgi:hypothetical protein
MLPDSGHIDRMDDHLGDPIGFEAWAAARSLMADRPPAITCNGVSRRPNRRRVRLAAMDQDTHR